MSWKLETVRRRGKLEALAELECFVSAIPALTPEQVLTEIRQRTSAEMAALQVPDSGPATSKAAARSLAIRAGSLRHAALLCYDRQDLTDEECGIAAAYPRIWPRCSELRTAGLIEPTGETRICARTGMACDVHRITDSGRAVLRSLDQPTEKP